MLICVGSILFLPLLSPLFPHPFLNGLGCHSHSPFHSFILLISTFFPHCIIHPRPTSFLSPSFEWTCACVHWPFTFWSMISCVIGHPSPPPLPSPPFFAEGAYALGAWSGYASAGGGDWGEALCPCCFRIALAIWGHRSWTVPARQLVPHETLNLSSCACYRRKMLLYRWKSTSIWSCCVCLSFFCRAWALDLWNWTTRRWQLFPQPACRGSVGWVWACNRFHTGQVLWSNSRELLHLSVIDFTQSPLILRALYPISVRWMKIDECQWDFQNRCLHHLLSLVSVNTQTL